MFALSEATRPHVCFFWGGVRDATSPFVRSNGSLSVSDAEASDARVFSRRDLAPRSRAVDLAPSIVRFEIPPPTTTRDPKPTDVKPTGPGSGARARARDLSVAVGSLLGSFEGLSNPLAKCHLRIEPENVDRHGLYLWAMGCEPTNHSFEVFFLAPRALFVCFYM